MGSITTIFSDDDVDERGKLICDIEALMNEIGQEIPDWLTAISKKYASRMKKERGLFSRVLFISTARLWIVCHFIWFILFTAASDGLKLLRFVIRSIVTTFINNEVKRLKSALWILIHLSFICLILFISFVIIFGDHSVKEGSESLYLNLQHFASDLYNNFKVRWLKKVRLIYDFYFT